MAVLLGPATVRFTGRTEGDLGSAGERGPSGPSAETLRRRQTIVDRPWSWLRQVHGARVILVDGPGVGAGEEADAAVSSAPGTALAVFTADCAPVAFASRDGVIGVAHVGWRGLAEGVVHATAEAMRALGATHIDAAIGPCIHPECYEFSPEDLDLVAARLGDGVRSTTASGAPALDLPAAAASAIEAAGVRLAAGVDSCTACATDASGDPLWFSHRSRRETARQAMVVWREP